MHDDQRTKEISPRWLRLLRSSFPVYLGSFLGGVFVSAATNLVTGLALNTESPGVPQAVELVLAAVAFLFAAAGATILAWNLDAIRVQWLGEGRPLGYHHVERILKPARRRVIIAAITTLTAILTGAALLCMAVMAK